VAPYAKNKGITLEFDTESEEIFTAVDIDKVERIILNLLSNAIKFTPTGGFITVKVGKSENNVAISVKDTGPGIPKNMQAYVFDRFNQVNSSLTRESEGTGIGLSLVKSFVSLHKGKVELISEENKGCEFIVELPIFMCEQDKLDSIYIKNCQNKILKDIKGLIYWGGKTSKNNSLKSFNNSFGKVNPTQITKIPVPITPSLLFGSSMSSSSKTSFTFPFS
jgi:anti-sigma regulatory factor (Ser/Thr protein kinase)